MAGEGVLGRIVDRIYFDSLGAFIEMDGHGGFVWAAYFISAVVILAILIVPVRRKRKLLAQIAGELKRAQRGPTTLKEGD